MKVADKSKIESNLAKLSASQLADMQSAVASEAQRRQAANPEAEQRKQIARMSDMDLTRFISDCEAQAKRG